MEASARVLIGQALAEDIGLGDVTAKYFVPGERQARAMIVARGEGVISGVDIAQMVFKEVDVALEVEALLPNGSRVGAGAVLMCITGSARSILTAERTALNFLQRLSGVATATARYVELVKGTNARILDTRKTTPGYRKLEKRAVLHGGGTNHRMGLYDRAMVKDNHLVAEGGLDEIQQSILRLKADHPNVEVEMEADRLDQVEAFLKLEGVDHILLDNMAPELMRKAVAMRGDRAKPYLEASGNVNLATVRMIAETGVDFISIGSITHSAPALDLGMDFVPGRP
ncbi:MAG: carboxylating nicotinate-nucleotide diphosphorylase [Luteolibacter sp.]